MRFLLPFILLFCSAFVLSADPREKNYPKDYFDAPVRTSIRLSGTFGELRSNHFHSGIDIKGYIGLALYAPAEGYVVRIKIQAGGYGRALYIAHPTGYTTVYAHMNRFTDELEEYVKSAQYEKESFEVDLYPPKNKFSFRQGEQIGEMGTTGYSFGPHLHFEVRDSKTEKPINPLLFGFKVADSLSPRMHQIKVYEMDEKKRTAHSQIYNLVDRGRAYGVSGDTVYVVSDQVGLALKVYDHMDGVRNWNGVYIVELMVDGAPYFTYEMESFSFDESRYLNAHLDYADQVSQKSYFNRLYTLPGNRLSIYPQKESGGILSLKAGQRAKKIQMKAYDAAGNYTELQFWLKRNGKTLKLPPESYQYVLPHDRENEIHNGSLFLRFPKGTFYEDLYMHYDSATDPKPGIYSPVYQVEDYKTPAHKYFDIAIQPIFLPDDLRKKAFVAYIDQDGDIVNYGGQWKNGMLQARVRDLGEFCIMADEEAPVIKPVSFSSNLGNARKITFKMTDNVATAGNARGLRYRATVNGKWILMEYDAKNDLLHYHFDERIKEGTHQLRIEVVDSRDNKAVFERRFSR